MTTRLWDLRYPATAFAVLKAHIGAIRSLRFRCCSTTSQGCWRSCCCCRRPPACLATRQPQLNVTLLLLLLQSRRALPGRSGASRLCDPVRRRHWVSLRVSWCTATVYCCHCYAPPRVRTPALPALQACSLTPPHCSLLPILLAAGMRRCRWWTCLVSWRASPSLRRGTASTSPYQVGASATLACCTVPSQLPAATPACVFAVLFLKIRMLLGCFETGDTGSQGSA